MNKKIILFDFDKTVSDTHGFVERFCLEVNKKFSITPEVCKEVLHEYHLQLDSSTDFRPEGYAQEMYKKTGINQDLIKEIIFDPKNHPLFPESFEVLTSLSKRCVLGIFSEGFEDWQKKKIQLDGIWDFFEPKMMIIERRKLLPESIEKIPKEATVVDDKKEVIKTLAQFRPDLKLVWINREGGDEISTPQIRTIKSLTELLD